MSEPVRESEFIETASGKVYFLGRWPDSGQPCVCCRADGGNTIVNADADVLWEACVNGPKCVECRAPLAFYRGYRDWQKREAAGLCFSCDHWLGLIAPDASVAVIDGFRYSISPDQPEGFRGFIGHGGAEFVIRFDDGREVTTRNLWANGRVPPHFSARIPNNARFIKASNHAGYVGFGSAAGARSEMAGA